MPQTIKLSLLAGWLLTVSGCGSSAYYWVKPGATDQERSQDHYACDLQSRYAVSRAGGQQYATGIFGFYDAQYIYRNCMLAHGWTDQGHP